MATSAKRFDLDRQKSDSFSATTEWTIGTREGQAAPPSKYPGAQYSGQNSAAPSFGASSQFSSNFPSNAYSTKGSPSSGAQHSGSSPDQAATEYGIGNSSERLRLLDPDLAESLSQLARLMANVTDSYTAAIFLSDSSIPGSPVDSTRSSHQQRTTSESEFGSSPTGSGHSASLSNQAHSSGRMLELVAFHTLSRDVIPHARIAFGSGLVGWTAENGVRISVCPFENDSSTLLFYSQDQALKSFIALPILDVDGSVVGVVSCDSKKSYAYAKITEKVLLDCAAQIAHLVTLHGKLRTRRAATIPTAGIAERDELNRFLDHLRAQTVEEYLLHEAANVSHDMVERDALVIVTAPQFETRENTLSGLKTNPRRNLGAGIFPSPTNQPRVNNRLMELVCRHKRVLCSDRNVHAQTSDEKLQRSFLSIPFRVMNKEAGSINVLSPAFGSFCANEILVLERMAEVIGHELELRRLRERVVSPQEKSGLLSWKAFEAMASARLNECLEQRKVSSLLRLRVPHPALLEDRLGVTEAQNLFQQVLRLIDQVKGSSGLACSLVGNDCLVFVEGNDCERLLSRLRLMIDRIELSSNGTGSQQKLSSQIKEEIKRNIHASAAFAPNDGDSLDILVQKTLRRLELGLQKARGIQKTEQSKEDTSNAFCW